MIVLQLEDLVGGMYFFSLLLLFTMDNYVQYFSSNCTSLQWWNGSYCRDKGTPAWGSNTSAICNATFECADYNLVSCPLGGNWPSMNSTCECATTKYWV